MTRIGMRFAAVAVLVLSPLAACGNDANDSNDEVAFCKLAKTVAEQDGFPSAAQSQKYRALAPPSLDRPLDIVEPQIKAHDGEIDPSLILAEFANDDLEDAVDTLDAYETKACGIDHPEDSAEVAINRSASRVDVIASEYRFDLPASIPAGKTSLVLKNAGQQAHFMYVVQLAAGKTLADYEAYQGNDSTAAGLTTDDGHQSRLAAPGGEDQEVLNADLPAGTYVMGCYLPGPDGTPHSALGMQRDFTVS